MKNRPLDMATRTQFKKNMYPRQKIEECEKNVQCKLCHKNVDKGEEVQ